MTLTNMVRPDIFVPGNHEFDFGKAVFLERMAEANFPLYAANLRGRTERRCPASRTAPSSPSTACASGSPARPTMTAPRASTPETWNSCRRSRAHRTGRGAAGAKAPTSWSRSCMPPRAGLRVIAATRSISFSPATTTICSSTMTAARHGRIELRRPLRDRDRRHDRREGRGRQAPRDLVAAVPRDRHRDGHARPRGGGFGGGLRGRSRPPLDTPIGTTAVELDSRNATVRTREAAIGDLVADAMRWRRTPMSPS